MCICLCTKAISVPLYCIYPHATSTYVCDTYPLFSGIPSPLCACLSGSVRSLVNGSQDGVCRCSYLYYYQQNPYVFPPKISSHNPQTISDNTMQIICLLSHLSIPLKRNKHIEVCRSLSREGVDQMFHIKL